MASFLDILASPNNVDQQGRVNPFAVARGFTQQGRAELDQQNQLNVNQPAAMNAEALFKAFQLGQEMATQKQLDGGQLGSFGATTARTGLEGVQLGNDANRQAISQQETRFGQEQVDARNRAINGQPMSPTGVSADIAYKGENRAQQAQFNQMEQFNVGAQQANRQLDQMDLARQDANTARQTATQLNEKELQQRKMSDFMQAYGMMVPSRGMPGAYPATEQYSAALEQQLKQGGLNFPPLPQPAGLSTLQKVDSQVRQQGGKVPETAAKTYKKDPIKPREEKKGPEVRMGGMQSGSFLDQFLNQPAQIMDLQAQLNHVLTGKAGPVNLDEVDRLRNQIAQLMKGAR